MYDKNLPHKGGHSLICSKKKKKKESSSKEKDVDDTKKKKKEEKRSRTFRVIPALNKSREDILKVIRRSFYQTEPLMSALGLVGTQVPPELDDYILVDLNEDLSLLAVGCLLEDIRGFAINGTITPYRKPSNPELMRCISPCARLLLKIWEYLEVQSNLTSCFKVDKVFEVRYIGTDPDYLRQGIAKALTVESLILAKKSGFEVASMFCTSLFSKHVAQSAGMDAVWTMPWSQYRDSRGMQIVAPKAPHTHVYVMAKKLT